MSKKTVVSDYIENKLNCIKRDSFLEEVNSSNESLYVKQSTILKEIDNINNYIKMIKENKKCYEIVNGKKVITPKVREYISNLKKIILKYREYVRYLKLLEKYQTRADIINNRIEIESKNVVLNDEQLKTLNSINDTTVEEIDFQDLIGIAKHLILNYEGINYKLELIFKELGSRFKHYEYNDEDFIALSSLKGVIHKKLSSLDKDDFRRAKLNEFKRYIKSIIELLRSAEDEQYDYRFEIVEHLMNDEYCFNRLLEDMPDIVNLKDKDGYTLAFNVVSKYLDAYLLELKGKSNGEVKDNYLKIYKKIITHPYYSNSDDNKIEIDSLIENFKEMIKNGKFRRDKYLEVINSLEQMNVLEEVRAKNLDVSLEELDFEQKYLLGQITNNYRINLIDEDTIVICSNNEKYHNYAYSVTKNTKGNHILKVHITNVREFIKPDSIIDLYLKNEMFKNEDNWINDELLNKFSLTLNNEKPAFTFEMEVTPRGKINNFKCYKSIIKVNDIYTYENVNKAIKNHDLRFLPYLEMNYFISKDIDKSNYAFSICNTFNKVVLNTIGDYFYKNKLPYIYKGQKEQDSVYYMQNMIKLNGLFSKISKEHFYKFYKIICDDVNYSRYCKKPEKHCSLGQNFYTDLFNPLYSYIGLFLQDMIEEFYINHPTGELLEVKKKMYNQEKEYLIKQANEVKETKREEIHKNKIKSLRGSRSKK